MPWSGLVCCLIRVSQAVIIFSFAIRTVSRKSAAVFFGAPAPLIWPVLFVGFGSIDRDRSVNPRWNHRDSCHVQHSGLWGPSDVKATMIYNRTVQSITLIETSLSAGIWKCDCLLMALNVSAGTARFRQLSEAMRKTHVRREHWPGASSGVTHRRIFLPFRNDDDAPTLLISSYGNDPR